MVKSSDDESNLKLLGERIRYCREQLGLSQDELAIKVGTSKSMISAYESGANDPRQSMVGKLATVLNADINWLMGREDQTDEYTGPPLSPPRAFLMDQARNASEDKVHKMEQLWKMIEDMGN